MKSRFLGILSLIILSFALVACNSSSDSSSAGGAVAAAPLKGASVFGKTAEGSDILIGTTNGNGSIVFNSSLSDVKFPSVVYSTGGTNFKTNAAFSGKLKGVMESSTSQVYLTPAQTLVAELYEDGMPLDEAQDRVEAIIEKEMGLNEVNPLANPLSNLNESEIVSQSLMAVLGVSEEDAAPMAAAIANIADEMQNNGQSFTDAARSEAGSSFGAGTMSLADFIESYEDEIVQAAKDALGDAANDAELNENVKVDKTEFPIAMTASSDVDVTESMVAKAYTININTTVFSNAVELNGKSKEFSNQKVVIASAPTIGTLTADSDTEFTYTVETADFDNVTLPVTVSFTLMSDEDNSIQLTLNTTFVDADSLTILEVGFNGAGIYEFEDNGVNKKALIGADNFVAWIKTVTDFADLNDNIDVRFVAPEGFKFEHTVGTDLTNTDTYDVATITKEDSFEYAAVIPADVVTLVTEDEVEAGYQTVGIQVIDEKTKAVLKTGSEELIFVPEDVKDQLTAITLGNTNINGDTTGRVIPIRSGMVDGSNVYTSDETDLVLEGTFKTWNSTANTDDDGDVNLLKAPAPDKNTLVGASGNGTFYVVSTADDAFIDVNTSQVADNIEITDISTITIGSDYSVTVDIEGLLKYQVPATPRKDTLRLMYVPKEGNGETRLSQGGLELDMDLTN